MVSRIRFRALSQREGRLNNMNDSFVGNRYKSLIFMLTQNPVGTGVLTSRPDERGANELASLSTRFFFSGRIAEAEKEHARIYI